MSDTIRYENVTKTYGDIRAVDDVSFSVKEGEFLAVVGPSGAGKTTILSMLAGFESPTEGRIFLDGNDVTKIPPHKRDTGTVFQDYALFPHMTVGENIAFGLKNKGYSKSKISDRVTEVLKLVDLPGFEDRKPQNLSGGQQQRVATARALAIEPEVLLMDEPLGALDKKLRDQLEVKIIKLQNELDITTLYVTHNQEEALKMADRIAVMNKGKIEQIGPPEEIYNEPSTKFVADFVGNTNFIDSSALEEINPVPVKADGAGSRKSSGQQEGFVRPERLSIKARDYDGPNPSVPAVIDQVIFVGSKTQYHVTSLGSEFVVEVQNTSSESGSFSKGEEVSLVFDDQSIDFVND